MHKGVYRAALGVCIRCSVRGGFMGIDSSAWGVLMLQFMLHVHNLMRGLFNTCVDHTCSEQNHKGTA